MTLARKSAFFLAPLVLVAVLVGVLLIGALAGTIGLEPRTPAAPPGPKHAEVGSFALSIRPKAALIDQAI